MLYNKDQSRSRREYSISVSIFVNVGVYVNNVGDYRQ